MLVIALTVGVAIVTGISLFTDRLQRGVVQQSTHFLAADNVLRSPRPIDPDWIDHARQAGLKAAETLRFQTMVYAGDAMQLASVVAVDNQYPLRGLLEKADRPFTPGGSTESGPSPGEVWLDSRLFPLLDIAVGDRVDIGDLSLTVAAVAINEPDRGTNFYFMGPRVVMNMADIPATHVVQPGSRVQYRYLFAGDSNSLNRFHQWLEPQLLPSHRWLSLDDAQPRIASALERAKSFLLLAGALGVALAGVAIALAARRYSERHFDYVAIMKSFGATSGWIFRTYAIHAVVLALIGSALGCAIGWLVQQLFISLFSGYFDAGSLPPISIQPFFIGLATAVVCMAAFALPPLMSLRSVAPLRVLRRDLPSTLVSIRTSTLLGGVAVMLLMYWYSGDARITLAVAGGIVAIIMVVGGGALWLLKRGARVGMNATTAIHLAATSLRRRGLFNAVQIVIFALATMLLMIMLLVRTALVDEWRMQLPPGTPNHFLINIAETQIGGIESVFEKNGVEAELMYPMARGRLITINGEAVRERVSKEEMDDVDVDRELNLTWSDTLPLGNIITDGAWWPSGSIEHQVSVEQRLARKLNIHVGDLLVFQLADQQLGATVGSIRALDWDTMKPNFYMIFPPPVLRSFPASYITSFHLPDHQKQFLNTLLQQYPTITVIAMDAVIKQVQQIVDQISRAIEVVLGLIVVSALLVLIASVRASMDARMQEGAVLRALGARKHLLSGALVIEFGVMGLLAGLFAVMGAEISTWIVQTRVLDMDYRLHPFLWFTGPLVAMLVIAVVGYVSGRRLVRVSPVLTLRQL